MKVKDSFMGYELQSEGGTENSGSSIDRIY